MPQTQVYDKEKADYQRHTNEKNDEASETQLVQKEREGRQAQCFQWLQTQAYLNKGEMQENKEESKHTTSENSGPIVIVNHMDSGHDILSLVEDLLKQNDFSNNSSLFVIVPSVEHTLGNSSDSQTSTICIQMSSNPLKWKKKAHPIEVDANSLATAAQQGVKISAKGKKFFMEGLPIDVLSFNNKDILNGHHAQSENNKKTTKNKLCQITSPEKHVRRTAVQRCHVISTDTTIDRPCCCPAVAAPDCTDYNTNDSYVANLISGVSGQTFLPRVSENPPSAPSCPASPCIHPHHTRPQEMPPKQLCQCTPERFLALLQQAVHDDRVQIMQSIGCGEGLKELQAEASEPPPGLLPTVLGRNTECRNCLYPSTRNKQTCTCLIHHTAGPLMAGAPQTGDGHLIESIEMGRTEQKQPSNKQRRFYSTIGTSTSPKLDNSFKNEEKMKNVICECPELKVEKCLVTKDIIDACEADIWKKNMVTERISVSKLNQRKQPPPQLVSKFHRDQPIRYYVLLKPEQCPSITGEQQAGDTTPVTEPSPSPGVASLEAPSGSQNDDDDPIQDFNIKLGRQSPSSTGAAGIGSVDLPLESFQSW